MTILSNLSIWPTDFTGRIFDHDLWTFELLLRALKLTQSGDEVVVITTGNLFDGPSPVSCWAVVYKKFGNRSSFFHCGGFHELLMTDAITQKYLKRQVLSGYTYS